MYQFDTSNRSFRQLFGNGLTYSVPRFQRDYSWTDEEWDDLWQDILMVVVEDQEPGHYLGYLVLQSSDNRSFEIIDGQQRLTTLSVLVLAVLTRLMEMAESEGEDSPNQKRAEAIRSSFVGYLDPVTLVASPKLSLNRNNDTFYRDRLVPLRVPSTNQGLNASERALRRAYGWYVSAVRRQFGDGASGEALARFVESVADRFFFTQIVVTDQLNAFKVFETLNARGVRLSATDLLKNYLFSIVHDDGAHTTDLDALERKWETIVGSLGAESFPEFLRVWWNSHNPTTRAHELFRAIRSSVGTRKQVFDLVHQMEEAVPIYLAIRDPDSELWSEHSKQQEVRRALRELKMFNVRRPYSLLVSAYRGWSESDFTRLARACSLIAFRANVIGNTGTSDQEPVFNRIAVAISSGKAGAIRDASEELRQVYPSDATFRAAFAEKQIVTTSSRNRKIVKYILHALEKQRGGIDFDYESERNTLEHILPESGSHAWEGFGDSRQRNVYRLGNLAVLERSLHKDIGNESISEKLAVYVKSEFVTTKDIATEYDSWTPEKIASRQKSMADVATSIWRIDL